VALDGTADHVAYDLHVGAVGVLTATRVAVSHSGYGFHNAGGSVALARGVLHAQLDAAGAVATHDDLLRTALDDVRMSANARDDVQVAPRLPRASARPTPSPPCVDEQCPCASRGRTKTTGGRAPPRHALECTTVIRRVVGSTTTSPAHRPMRRPTYLPGPASLGSSRRTSASKSAGGNVKDPVNDQS
jgi:hypothetical protein